MESALSTILMMTVTLFAALTLSHTYLESQDVLMISTRAMEARNQEQADTEMEIVEVLSQSSGSIVQLTLLNTGKVKLTNFEQWDMVVEYYRTSGQFLIQWLPYTSSSLNQNEWTAVGIYMDAGALLGEEFNMGIWDPGGQLVLRAHVFPPVGTPTTNRITLGVSNGVHMSALFTR
jgi:hypothetical protein